MPKKSQKLESMQSKKQENVLNSDSPSMESGSSEKTGHKHTRPRYLEDKARMYVNGKRYRLGHPNHPYHNIYKHGGFNEVFKAMGIVDRIEDIEEVNNKCRQNYDKFIGGEIYVLSNPAWKGWYKIGMAANADDRLLSYQTSAPFRDFKIEYRCFTKDRARAERRVHAKIGKHIEQRNEWFKAPKDYAISLCNLLR